MSITDNHVVALFQDYYDSIFESGIVLKDADDFDEREIESLRRESSEWDA